jgi:hypothetical protein
VSVGCMKHKKTRSSTFIFLLLVAGIIFSIFSVKAGQGQHSDAEIAMAKTSVVDPTSSSKEGQKFFSEVSYPLPTTHFEPMLLFMLGTILLSIVTGINLLRARKIEFPLHSVGQADLPGPAQFGGRKPSADKNEAT